MPRKLIGFFVERTTPSAEFRDSTLIPEDSKAYSYNGLLPNTRYTFYLITTFENKEHVQVAEISITTGEKELLHISKVCILIICLIFNHHNFYVRYAYTV